MKLRKLFLQVMGAFAAVALLAGCADDVSSSKAQIDPDGKFGTLVVKKVVTPPNRALDTSEISSAEVSVLGYGIDSATLATLTKTASVTSGAGSITIENVPVGKNRVVKVVASTTSPVTMYGVCDINAYTDGTSNTANVSWSTTPKGAVYAALLAAGEDISVIEEKTVTDAIAACGGSSLHGSVLNASAVASYIKDGGTAPASVDLSGSLSLTASNLTDDTASQATGAVIEVLDPASQSVTGIGTSALTISGIAPGTWTLKITNNSKTVTKSVTITSGETTSVSVEVPGITQVVTSAKSGVMLQGFTWNSAPRGTYGQYSLENPSPNWGKWYNIVISRAADIKDTFAYMWCPPPSKTDTNSSEGYAPTQLNDLNNCYGTKDELSSMISAISPTKAIADIVINHRAGTTSWADFTNPSWTDDYYSICYDDECFTDSSSPAYNNSKRGATDSGDTYGAYRDLDHTNSLVQQGIIDWMNNVLKPAGFVGWRYDYVKGYGAQYVGKYNAQTEAEFSVGEYWPTAGYDASNPSGWGNSIKTWISDTEANGGQRSRAFDFALKGAMNDVFGYYYTKEVSSGNYSQISNSGSWNFARLADSANLYISQPSDAVTFVDNHDTGSNQGHWGLNTDCLGTAYALILTHPGVPCVAWNHYFTFAESGSISATYPYSGMLSDNTYYASNTVAGTSNTLRAHIDYLIDLRKSLGVEYDSTRTTLNADSSGYVAEVEGLNGSLIVLIGSGYSPSDSDYELNYSGTNFAIWTKGGSAKCKAPVITISGGTCTITCATEGAAIKYSTDGTNYSTYSAAFAVTEGTTVYAKATADGLEDSSVVSKTYSSTVTIELSATRDAGSGNGVFFTGTFEEGQTWTIAVRGTWTTGNVWKATVTVPSSGTFVWKALQGTYSWGESVTISTQRDWSWQAGDNHSYPGTTSTSF